MALKFFARSRPVFMRVSEIPCRFPPKKHHSGVDYIRTGVIIGLSLGMSPAPHTENDMETTTFKTFNDVIKAFAAGEVIPRDVLKEFAPAYHRFSCRAFFREENTDELIQAYRDIEDLMAPFMERDEVDFTEQAVCDDEPVAIREVATKSEVSAAVKATPLADQIKRARKSAGLTQSQLAELVGSTQGRVADWENERRRMTIETLEQLAAALSTTFEIGADIMENAHDTISNHFANWGDETNAHDGFAAFAWDALDETRTALGDGSGEQFDQLASDVAYSVNQEGRGAVTEAQAAAWILEERDELVEAVDAAIALMDE